MDDYKIEKQKKHWGSLQIFIFFQFCDVAQVAIIHKYI